MVVTETAEPMEAAERIPLEAKRILYDLASEWGDVANSEALEVVHLKGAMTNEVYQVNWPTLSKDGVSRKVLVRIYGEGVDVFFDREDEIRTFECMSRHGQGPLLLGRFANGRVEEFINARTLSAADLRDPEVSALIASKLKEFHNLDMPGPRKDYEYASFNPVAYDLANHFCEMAANYHTETPHILDFNKYPGCYLGRLPSVFMFAVVRHGLGEMLTINLVHLQEHVNEIDFEYMDYARQRFQQYWLMKPKLLGSE
ncbi:hypothetical protein BHE74_00054736 [Ensete ventricosum]|nr:hypothetical protein BHE74_00054736 [Ensete ventricosum]RZS03899.1 hypothetical protein BHM03_00034171 [Ensete ventricosum]